jgi:hypothetical protein
MKVYPYYEQWLKDGRIPFAFAKAMSDCEEVTQQMLHELHLLNLVNAAIAAQSVGVNTEGTETPGLPDVTSAGVAGGMDFDSSFDDGILQVPSDGSSDSCLEDSSSSNELDDEEDGFVLNHPGDDGDDGPPGTELGPDVGRMPKTFLDITRGWAVRYGISKAALTGFFAMLLVYRPDMDYVELARMKTGRKLLKV